MAGPRQVEELALREMLASQGEHFGPGAIEFGRFAPPKPLDIRVARKRGNAGLADKARPAGESIRRASQARWQMAE